MQVKMPVFKVSERILVMGITGSGKSFMWLKMAEQLREYGVKFYCLDTDNDIEYMIETGFHGLNVKDGGNVHVYPAYNWPSYEEGFNKIMNLGPRPQDWIVVDKINRAWSTVQNYYVHEVFKENPGQYFLEIRKKVAIAAKNAAKDAKAPTSIMLEGLDGWMDWSVINKLYDDWISPLVFQTRSHVYCATDVELIDKKEKNAEIRELFGQYGIRPAGQKSLGGQMHTIFLLKPGTDKWFISTIKDRSRDRGYFKDVQINSFLMQYLVMKAGWKLP